MSAWYAVLWGALASSSLFIGQALADPLRDSRKPTGLLMGFGAGTLISAVGFQLVPEESFGHDATAVWVGASLGAGALTYYVADRLVDARGGGKRQRLDAGEDPGSPWAMYIGALLDGVPESFVLGTTLAVGGAIDVAFLAAVFVSNVPQGVAGTQSLRAAGASSRHVLSGWAILTGVCAAFAGAGYVLSDAIANQGVYVEAFAGGAVLTMLADSMMPEAFRYGGRAVGLFTVLGYMVAAVLAVAQ
jgi:zinc transporter, ZIP family